MVAQPITDGTDDVKRLLLCGAALVASLAHAMDGPGADTQLRALIEAAQREPQRKGGGDKQKVADFYASYMDVERIERLGYRPLIGELQRIRQLRDRRGLPHTIAHLSQIGVPMPYAIDVAPDATGNSTMARIVPGPLGLVDPEAYFATATAQKTLAKYGQHIETILTLGGTRDAAASAHAALALETRLAQLQRAPSVTPDPGKAPHDLASTGPTQQHTIAIDQLGATAPGYDWAGALGAAGIAAKSGSVLVVRPDYLAGVARLAADADLASWKAYLEWQLLRSFAPYLSQAFVSAEADFHTTATGSAPKPAARWERGVRLVAEALPDLLDSLALAPAAASTPGSVRDTNALAVSPLELVGNVMRVRQLNTARLLARIGKPLNADAPAGQASGK